MQTFLPFLDFSTSASRLDSKRLNKQILEAYQILTDRVPNSHHPACLMWSKNKKTLKKYILSFCREYTRRFSKIHSIQDRIQNLDFQNEEGLFLKNPEYRIDLLLLSHKINLLRKDYEFYKDRLGITLSKDDLNDYPTGYYWPICLGETSRRCSKEWISYGLNIN